MLYNFFPPGLTIFQQQSHNVLCRKQKFSEKLKPCVSRTVCVQWHSIKFFSAEGKKNYISSEIPVDLWYSQTRLQLFPGSSEFVTADLTCKRNGNKDQLSCLFFFFHQSWLLSSRTRQFLRFEKTIGESPKSQGRVNKS